MINTVMIIFMYINKCVKYTYVCLWMCQIIGAFYFFFVKKPGLIFKFQYLFLIFNFSIFKIFPSRFNFQFFWREGIPLLPPENTMSFTRHGRISS